MRWVRRAPFALVALVAAGMAGCDGDDNESSSAVGDAGADAASGDATVNDAEGGTVEDATVDAPGDAPREGSSGLADAGILACTTWRYATPVVLEDLSLEDAGGTFSGVWVFSPATDQVRIYAQPTGGAVFRLYGYDKGQQALTTLDAPAMAGVELIAAHHFAAPSSSSGVTQVLAQSSPMGTLDTTQISAYLIDDALPMTGPLPAPLAVSPGYGGVAAVPFDGGGVFDAVRYLESADGATLYYGLGVGLATASSEATLANVQLSDNESDFQFPAVAHANGNVYVFTSNGAPISGESVFTVPETANVPSFVQPRAFSSGDDGRMIDVAPGEASGTTNVAYWSQASDGSSSSIRAGQLTSAQLDTVTAGGVPLAFASSDTSLATATFSTEWQGDEMMLIGPSAGRLEDGGSVPGVIAVWIDALHGLRADTLASAPLLADRPTIRLAAASPSSVSATSGAWDVAWIETRADGSEALLYDELDCQ